MSDESKSLVPMFLTPETPCRHRNRGSRGRHNVGDLSYEVQYCIDCGNTWTTNLILIRP